jgi:ADP-ribose pyrophosphatase YjhB (NUDIX family)
MTSIPTEYAVAIVLRNGHRPDDFLVIKRPSTDLELGGCWGFPAIMLTEDESPEEGARRVCKEKLGCEGEPIRFLGAMHQERDGYNLLLMEIEVILVSGSYPDVSRASTQGTVYVDQTWSKDPEVVRTAARSGSCCSNIFLSHVKVLHRDEWPLTLQKN